MKKIISIVIILLIGYDFVGYYVHLNILLYTHKQKIYFDSDFNESEKVEFITISKRQINKRTEDFKQLGEKEISYKGHLYDIVKVLEYADYITFHAIKDEKEQKILTELDSNYNSDTTKSQESNDLSFAKFFLKDYFFLTSLSINSQAPSISFQFCDLTLYYPQFMATVIAPPPKQLS